MTLAGAKAAARRQAFDRRKLAHAGRTGGETGPLIDVLAAHAGRVLAGYMPMRTEIDPLPAMAAHHRAGGRVCVPVILGPGQPLKFREWAPGAAMVAGDFDALIPETGDWLAPEVLVVPMVAFDRQGYRLGYGGGFYDRTLEGLRARGPVTAIGFAYALQELDQVPVEPTDQPLDLIVTEEGAMTPGL